MPNLAIRAEYAHLVSLFVSDEDSRYYLKGFCVEPAACGGVYIVATDGHRLGLFHDRLGVCDQPSIWRLDPATLKACVAKKKDDNFTRWLVIEQAEPGTDFAMGYHNVTVALGDKDFPDNAIGLARSKAGSDLKMYIAQAKPIDGPFPEYKRVLPRNMPDLAKTKLQAYNGDYIASFTKVAATREGDYTKHTPTLMIASDELGSPSVVLTGRDDFVGIIMPVYGINVFSALPDWYPASGFKPAAAAAE